MALLADERFAILVSAARDYAFQAILFDRDQTDSFRLEFEGLGTASHTLSRQHLLSALPVGSRWAPAVGWSSYVVTPPRALGSTDLALIGLEYVLPHETRGAYPVLGGVVLLASDVATVLRAIASSLDPDAGALPPKRCVYHSEARTPEEHRGPAAALLRAAAAAFAIGKRPLVRTAILSEDEVPAKWMILKQAVFVGTVPGLFREFSFWTRKILT